MFAGASPTLLPLMLCNLVSAAVLAGAAVMTLRRSVSSQVVARGIAVWAVVMGLWPYGGAVWVALHAFVATLALAALWLSRPALDTPEARAEFDPLSHRRVFLAGATVSVFVAVSSALALVWLCVSRACGHTHGDGPSLLSTLFPAIAFLAAAVGVCRMRAWGVLLGIAASVVEGWSLQARHPLETLGLATVLAPGLLFGAALVAARMGPGKRARVGGAVDEPEHALGQSSRPRFDRSDHVEADDDVTDLLPAERTRVAASS
jgi:hypothetical protein